MRAAIVAVCVWRAAAAIAGGGERDFLGKRPGLSQDVQLWNSFLRSEGEASSSISAGDPIFDPPAAGVFLDATNQQGIGKSSDRRLQVALQSCLKKHFSTQLKQVGPMPVTVPRGNLAAVAAAAAAHLNTGTKQDEKLVKERMQACLKTSQEEPKSTSVQGPVKAIVASASSWASFGGHTKPSFLEFNATDPCTDDFKQCKKDKSNCKNVLDILQFLRLQHIAVEKSIQRDADAKKDKKSMLLQSVLEEHGFTLPKPQDWQWTGAKRKLLLQTALEQKSLALPNQEWGQWTPSSPPLVHEVPNIDNIRSHYHQDLPLKQAALPLEFHNLPSPPGGMRCPFDVQKKIDSCHASFETCKVDVDDHESILNAIAPRAGHARELKLQKYLHPQ